MIILKIFRSSELVVHFFVLTTKRMLTYCFVLEFWLNLLWKRIGWLWWVSVLCFLLKQSDKFPLCNVLHGHWLFSFFTPPVSLENCSLVALVVFVASVEGKGQRRGNSKESSDRLTQPQTSFDTLNL